MQPNKTKIALLLGAISLGASGVAHAATASFDITVGTIPDVTLTEITALDYGTSMFVTAGGTCLMNAATPGTSAGLKYIASAAVAASNYGALTGTGCVNGTATPGLYKIKGVAGQAVKITISGVTGTDFSFSPNSGCIVQYDGAGGAGTGGDSCTSFVPGVVSPAVPGRKLAANTEDETGGTAAGEASESGALFFTVGGTVTIGGTDLTANQAYTESFPVTVIY